MDLATGYIASTVQRNDAALAERRHEQRRIAAERRAEQAGRSAEPRRSLAGRLHLRAAH